MRQWLETIKDPTRDVYDRRYRLLSAISIVLLGLWILFSMVTDYHQIKFTFFGITEIAFVVIYLTVIRTEKTYTAGVLSSVYLVFVMSVFAFFYNGGIGAGAPNWFLMALIYTLMTVKGRMRIFLVVSDLVVAGICYTLSYYHPEYVLPYSVETAYLDSLASLIITAVMVISMIFFQSYISKQEKDILEAQRREIEDLNRAQNNFFSSMSHEIRTPINTIIGMNELILREETISDEVVGEARAVEGASKMLLALINDILDKSKIESGKMEIVPVTYDTGAMLSEVVGMVWGRATEKGLDFHVDVDPALPSALIGDEVRIKQVLVNLLNNAVKYTNEGYVKMTVQGDRIEGGSLLLTMRVEDSGMGIRREAIPHLFDAFKRVDEEKNRNIEGTGLGLSIVKQLMELMRGEVTVSSVYTKGSIFTVTLPQEIANGEAIGETRLHTHGAGVSREHYKQSFEAPKARILIVDDNDMNLRVEKKLLEDTKMTIDTALSGAEALKLCERTHYDVIMMDHLMPEMDGITCLKALRTQEGGMNRETPVIALTANAGSENRALYASSGFDAYLLKPVSGRQLEDALLKTLPEHLVGRSGAISVQAKGDEVFGSLGKKRRVLITIDSAVDMPVEWIGWWSIPVIYHRIETAHGLFRDGTEIDSDELMRYMLDESAKAKSVVPDAREFEQFFASHLGEAQHIIHISIADQASPVYRSAKEAERSFDSVTVIDSGNMAGGAGLLAMYAVHLAGSDLSAGEVTERILDMKERIASSFVLEGTGFLLRGGRMKPVTSRLLNAFLLHPVIVMSNDRMNFYFVWSDRYRKSYIRKVFSVYKHIDTSLLMISYAGLSEEELNWVRSEVEHYAHFDRVVCVPTSSAVAVNVGHGTFGLIFHVLKDATDKDDRLFDFLPAAMTAVRGAADEEAAEEEKAHEEEPAAGPEAGPEAVEETGEECPLNRAEGLKNCGSAEGYEAALRLFAETAGGRADEIEGYLSDADWDNYTIKVHALKSSLRLIGAGALSDDAAHLEALGNVARHAENGE